MARFLGKLCPSARVCEAQALPCYLSLLARRFAENFQFSTLFDSRLGFTTGAALCAAPIGRRPRRASKPRPESFFTMNFASISGTRQISRGAVTVHEHESAVKWKSGRLVGVLSPGFYRLWSWQKSEIWVFDARRTLLSVGGQKLLTLDGVTVTLSLVAEYEIADAALLVTRVASFQSLLYEEIQLAAREVVAARPLNELLAQRHEINAALTQNTAEKARQYGVLVSQLAIKDTVLSNRVRELLMKEVEAKRLAQAALIGAREEVAALRALSNAARLVRENPELLRLRELEVARTLSQNGGTLVLGALGAVPLASQNVSNAASKNPTFEAEASA